MRLVIFEKGPHSSFLTCQAKPNSFNTPNRLGWPPVVQGRCWKHTRESASEQCYESWATSPGAFRCLMDVLHPRVAAQLHITMEASQFSQGPRFHPWNHRGICAAPSTRAYTHPGQQLVPGHKWESQTLAASPLGPSAETYRRIKGMRCHVKPSSGGEAHTHSVTALPILSTHRSRDGTV